MTRLATALLMMGTTLALAGCGGGGSDGVNPPQLWLNYDGDELHVKLQPVMPNPF